MRGENATGFAMIVALGVRGQSGSPLANRSANGRILLEMTCVSYRDLFSWRRSLEDFFGDGVDGLLGVGVWKEHWIK